MIQRDRLIESTFDAWRHRYHRVIDLSQRYITISRRVSAARMSAFMSRWRLRLTQHRAAATSKVMSVRTALTRYSMHQAVTRWHASTALRARAADCARRAIDARIERSLHRSLIVWCAFASRRRQVRAHFRATRLAASKKLVTLMWRHWMRRASVQLGTSMLRRIFATADQRDAMARWRLVVRTMGESDDILTVAERFHSARETASVRMAVHIWRQTTLHHQMHLMHTMQRGVLADRCHRRAQCAWGLALWRAATDRRRQRSQQCARASAERIRALTKSVLTKWTAQMKYRSLACMSADRERSAHRLAQCMKRCSLCLCM
jgi:hypothetical protein